MTDRNYKALDDDLNQFDIVPSINNRDLAAIVVDKGSKDFSVLQEFRGGKLIATGMQVGGEWFWEMVEDADAFEE